MQSVRLLISLVDDDIVHFLINVRENRKGNQKWTIQRNWQQMVHKKQDEDKQNKNHNTI
jgi:hypothetical protein